MRISVEGNIGSGKSACVQALSRALEDVPCFPEPVEEWGEMLSLFYRSPADWAFLFGLRVLLSFAAPHREERCVVERSPLASRHVFSQLLYNDGLMNHHEWETFKEYHAVLGWKPDVIFYVDTPTDVCMERVRKRGRESESAIDIQYLKRLEFQYINMLRFADVPIIKFDGTLPEDTLHARIVAEAEKWLRGA